MSLMIPPSFTTLITGPPLTVTTKGAKCRSMARIREPAETSSSLTDRVPLIDIYSGVLMVRELLSWFPNIPWDRQPLSAIRDLCDPYLNLFTNIIPLIFDTLDVSPLLAFAILGTLPILNNNRGAY
ncbi:hypothetical protein IFM89_022781 [Coptis chinensis]|uniref:Uncharacterized protein n=1 Tax=Coptis chinensis TaxID=261450 RepID=A0A835IUM1_9MAGN|nr:hypothetical protein IFM89_022781 [Coptis chinensis]